MNGKASSAAQAITLPKGGGALRGLGERFAPDLHTGTGNFTIPIAVPAGRNGLEPRLDLGYSTGTGNGALGLGWGLSVPGVTRRTSHGVPVYDDDKDTFVLSGAEELIAIPGAPGLSTHYRPRTEGLFARIEHVRDQRQDYWEVRGKNGLVSLYGTPRPDDPEPDSEDPAVVADPERPGRVFAWKLTRTTDPFGNRIEYRYDRDDDRRDGPHHWARAVCSGRSTRPPRRTGWPRCSALCPRPAWPA